MLTGTISTLRVPQIELEIGGGIWTAIIDTGFNGGAELPLQLFDALSPTLIGSVESSLAGGQRIVEDCYLVELKFDGVRQLVEVTFAECGEILVGTGLLREHRLEIDFPLGNVVLHRVVTTE